jgi:hypothetical protein
LITIKLTNMNCLKSKFVLITVFSFFALSIQTNAQPTPSKEGIKDIQDLLDKMKALKKAGKKPGDPKVVELAVKAIHLADSSYQIPPDNLPDKADGSGKEEPTYDPDSGGDGESGIDGKKVKVTLGRGAFSSPGWLASTKLHEIVAHGGQAAGGTWYDDAKGTEINEVEAYDAELADSTKNGLSREEIDELLKRRKEHYDNLDKEDKALIKKEKKDGKPYKLPVKKADGKKKKDLIGNTHYFVAGTVLSEERMQVGVAGTKVIEGIVFTAELNGKKTTARTNANGNAILDMAPIAAGITGAAVAIIKTFDAAGKELNSTTTTVQPGSCAVFSRPQIEALPDNLPRGEAVTISGQNLGSDAQLVMDDEFQETLSASDKEITVFCDAKPGSQAAFVVTANGVSESKIVNIYALGFNLPKSSISPGELVAAEVDYEFIPVGTRLIFTNISPQTVKMTIPGAQNAANECIYTVSKSNGTIPVNITGITNGSFKVGLDLSFKDNNHSKN